MWAGKEAIPQPGLVSRQQRLEGDGCWTHGRASSCSEQPGLDAEQSCFPHHVPGEVSLVTASGWLWGGHTKQSQSCAEAAPWPLTGPHPPPLHFWDMPRRGMVRLRCPLSPGSCRVTASACPSICHHVCSACLPVSVWAPIELGGYIRPGPKANINKQEYQLDSEHSLVMSSVCC